MAFIIDIVLIAIIALFTFIGYKQGLVKAAIKILSFFIAIAIALILYKPISGLVINHTTIDDKIKNTITANVKIEERQEEVQDQSNIVKENLSNKIIAGANNTIEQMAEAFTVKLIEIIVMILLYIIVRIILKFISALTDVITNLPILKQINKTGGTIYGFLKGIIIVHVLLAIIYLASPVINNTAFKEIDNTIITKQIYNNNVLLKIVF